jgi:AhpD family alkylhydroperoxidase
MTDAIKSRFIIKEIEPAAYKAMSGLQSYVDSSLVKPLYREMIKIRASQINGCAYCIESHARDARKMGETESRIYALSAWRESPLFSDEERAILALTEEVTLIASGGVSDKVFDNILRFFSEVEVTQLIMQIIAINAWNRIAVSTHMVHK